MGQMGQMDEMQRGCIRDMWEGMTEVIRVSGMEMED